MVNNKSKLVPVISFLLTLVILSALITPVIAQTKVEYNYDDDQGLVTCGKGNDTSKMCRFNDLFKLIGRIMGFLLKYIMLPVAALSFGIAGFMYMFSGGDPGKRKTATELFTDTLYGIIIILVAWLLVWTIVDKLGIKDGFNPLSK